MIHIFIVLFSVVLAYTIIMYNIKKAAALYSIQFSSIHYYIAPYQCTVLGPHVALHGSQDEIKMNYV